MSDKDLKKLKERLEQGDIIKSIDHELGDTYFYLITRDGFGFKVDIKWSGVL